jgi:hypothetical protein
MDSAASRRCVVYCGRSKDHLDAWELEAGPHGVHLALEMRFLHARYNFAHGDQIHVCQYVLPRHVYDWCVDDGAIWLPLDALAGSLVDFGLLLRIGLRGALALSRRLDLAAIVGVLAVTVLAIANAGLRSLSLLGLRLLGGVTSITLSTSVIVVWIGSGSGASSISTTFLYQKWSRPGTSLYKSARLW